MNSKVSNNDSWRSFWLFECYLSLMAVLIVPFLIYKAAGKTNFTFGGALLVGLIAAFGCVGLGLIHRTINRRNNGLDFFLIMTTCGTIPLGDVSLPIGEIIVRQAAGLLFYALFITLSEMIYRAWTSRRSKQQVSPLADAEIHARPIA